MKNSELNKIERSKKVTHCYILKHGSYYRPNACGYTGYRVRAGIYTKEDALRQARSCRDLYIVPINQAEHNQLLADEIKEISTRFI